MTRSETNEWLKALYEAMGPECFVPQYFGKQDRKWNDCVSNRPSWSSAYKYRLKPIVPDGCEPIPEAAYCYGPDRRGAVCLIDWKDSLVDCVAGWALECGEWERSESWLSPIQGPFLLDLSQQNATEIVRRNTGKRLPWDSDHVRDSTESEEAELEAALDVALESALSDYDGVGQDGNSITIKADRCEISAQDGRVTVRWW